MCVSLGSLDIVEHDSCAQNVENGNERGSETPAEKQGVSSIICAQAMMRPRMRHETDAHGSKDDGHDHHRDEEPRPQPIRQPSSLLMPTKLVNRINLLGCSYGR